jgi:hypothetical protein
MKKISLEIIGACDLISQSRCVTYLTLPIFRPYGVKPCTYKIIQDMNRSDPKIPMAIHHISPKSQISRFNAKARIARVRSWVWGRDSLLFQSVPVEVSKYLMNYSGARIQWWVLLAVTNGVSLPFYGLDGVTVNGEPRDGRQESRRTSSYSQELGDAVGSKKMGITRVRTTRSWDITPITMAILWVYTHL